jgi:coenzyme F420 hydrogenase subunit beta
MAKLKRISFEESLGKDVLPSLCVGCASCVVTCPIGCLDYIDGRPVLSKECSSCGICARICPRYKSSWPELEHLIFNRERRPDEEFGVYRRMVIARTRDKKIREVCQDGGVVTSLLLYALENEIIDGAAVSGTDPEKPLMAIPRLATSEEELIASAGTRYTYSPNLFAFKEGVDLRKERIAFVGTPCQILAIRKIQALPLNRFAKRLNITVGVFCSECFSYEGLANKLIKEELGISPGKVKRMNIKGKLIISTVDGDVKSVPLKEAKKYANSCVNSCPDFSAELADISVGGLGLEGWTFTILRTERGEALFDEAASKDLLETRPVDADSRAFRLLVKLSKRKRRTAERKVS